VKAHVKEDRTESRLTNAQKADMERSEERGNGRPGSVIVGRGTVKRSEERGNSWRVLERRRMRRVGGGGGRGRGREEEGRRGAQG